MNKTSSLERLSSFWTKMLSAVFSGKNQEKKKLQLSGKVLESFTFFNILLCWQKKSELPHTHTHFWGKATWKEPTEVNCEKRDSPVWWWWSPLESNLGLLVQWLDQRFQLPNTHTHTTPECVRPRREPELWPQSEQLWRPLRAELQIQMWQLLEEPLHLSKDT